MKFALAAVCVALALQISSGMFDPAALALVTAALVLAATATVRGDSRPLATQVILGAGCAGGLACHLFANPTFYGDPARLAGFRWLAAAALVLLSAYLCLHLRASLVRARFLLLLLCFLAMGAAIIHASPRPWIDVWVVQQRAADALIHQVNPYSATYPNIYGPRSAWYTPELIRGGRLAAFPYPPLSVLATVPAFALLGDVRYAMLLAMAGAAWLLARATGNELGALLILFQPRSFFVLEQAWTEPLVAVWFSLALVAVLRRPALAGLALGALLASKQYAFFLAIPLWFMLPRRQRLKGALIALATAAAVTLPFFALDPAGFWRGVVRMQFAQPFRPDGLSLLAAWARAGGPVPDGAGLIAPLVGTGVLIAGLRRRPGLQVSALVWLAVVISSKQGFCNYYWLCVALLCAAAAPEEKAA